MHLKTRSRTSYRAATRVPLLQPNSESPSEKVSGGNQLSVQTWKLKGVPLNCKQEVQIKHLTVPCILQRNTRFLTVVLHKNPYSFYLNRNEVRSIKTGIAQFGSYSTPVLLFSNSYVKILFRLACFSDQTCTFSSIFEQGMRNMQTKSVQCYTQKIPLQIQSRQIKYFF
jgi:hypothetical protein